MEITSQSNPLQVCGPCLSCPGGLPLLSAPPWLCASNSWCIHRAGPSPVCRCLRCALRLCPPSLSRAFVGCGTWLGVVCGYLRTVDMVWTPFPGLAIYMSHLLVPDPTPSVPWVGVSLVFFCLWLHPSTLTPCEFSLGRDNFLSSAYSWLADVCCAGQGEEVGTWTQSGGGDGTHH